MNLESHLASLEAKHTNLEARINEESQRPAPDDIRIQALKKQKLMIKEELTRLAAH